MNMSFKTARFGAALLFNTALLSSPLLTPAMAADAPTSSTLAQLEQSHQLRVGMSTFAPWAMRDKQGALIGFEIDVARRLASDNGWQVEFVPTAWDGIIPSLLAKKYDVIIGGLTITPEREKSVRFTNAYSHSGIQLAASRTLAADKKTVADFNQRGVILAVRRGASPAQVAKANFPKATLRQFDDESQVFQEVLNGRAHGALSSSPKPEQEA
ncbi:MAG: transporter substrate-binding domain-containing protein, partial [Aeromonas sp.]